MTAKTDAANRSVRLPFQGNAAYSGHPGLKPISAELRKELGGPKIGGARLRHNLGGLPGNATLKHDLVFWVEALPSRAQDAAIIQSFELDRFSVRSALFQPLLMPHAGPRLGGFAALPTTDSTTSAALLHLKGRSGASPHQSWGPQLFPLTQRLWAKALLFS